MDVRGKLSNEKRLIDADAFLEKMKRTSRYFDVVFDVEEMPTVDAVEVVRCRDCFYYTPVNDKIGKCVFLIGAHQYAVPDGYCYLGERKEGAD